MESELCILLYHGVTAGQSEGIENYSRKHMLVEDFRSQMEFVAEHCHLISMDDVAEHCCTGKAFAPRSLAVTFDDAFENVFTTAFPVLRELCIPFTFYLSTSFIDSEKMFWVDIIEDCINRAQCDEIDLLDMELSLGLGSRAERIRACERVKAFCKSADIKSKDAVLGALIEQTGVTPSVLVGSNYRKVRWTQLRAMLQSVRASRSGRTHPHPQHHVSDER